MHEHRVLFDMFMLIITSVEYNAWIRISSQQKKTEDKKSFVFLGGQPEYGDQTGSL